MMVNIRQKTIIVSLLVLLLLIAAVLALQGLAQAQPFAVAPKARTINLPPGEAPEVVKDGAVVAFLSLLNVVDSGCRLNVKPPGPQPDGRGQWGFNLTSHRKCSRITPDDFSEALINSLKRILGVSREEVVEMLAHLLTFN